MSAKKSAPKSAGKPIVGVPFTGADDPRRGRGPKKGAPNAGRPRQDYLDWVGRAISNKKTEAAVRKILRDPDHPQFGTLYSKLAERKYGRAGATDVQIPIPPAQLTTEQLERIAQGEDPLMVLATTRASAEAATQPSATAPIASAPPGTAEPPVPDAPTP